VKYKAKSIIVGRKKRDPAAKKEDDTCRPCFVALYNINDPHLSDKTPEEILEFEKIDKIDLKDFKVEYLLAGNDLVVNNLQDFEITKKRSNLVLTGKQI
tara:strand:- start:15115 stop:15411 length:297 start_codon:yes stop_codon:yes gene_type:complete